jgi:hypothetical protein
MDIPGSVSELLDVLVELAAANIQKKGGEHERNTERIECAVVRFVRSQRVRNLLFEDA